MTDTFGVQARLPAPLSFEGNVADNFKKFKQLFEIFLLASGNDKQPPERKVAILLNVIGEDGVDVFNNFDLNDTDKKDYGKVIQEFQAYTNPKKNVLYDRFIFYNRNKEEGESFEHYYQELKNLIKTCEFKDNEEMLRDRLVFGCNNKFLQERLLNLKEIALKEIVNTCRNHEIVQNQVKVIQQHKAQIDVLKKKEEKVDKREKEMVNQKKQQTFNNKFDCKKCGKKHGYGKASIILL